MCKGLIKFSVPVSTKLQVFILYLFCKKVVLVQREKKGRKNQHNIDVDMQMTTDDNPRHSRNKGLGLFFYFFNNFFFLNCPTLNMQQVA